MRLLLVIVLALFGAGCGDYSYHPNYIISHDKEQPIQSTPENSL